MVKIEAHLSEQLDHELKELAEATGRSVPSLINEAIDAYVEEQRAFIRAVEEGIKAADEGRIVDHETVVAHLEHRRRGA